MNDEKEGHTNKIFMRFPTKLLLIPFFISRASNFQVIFSIAASILLRNASASVIVDSASSLEGS